MAITKLHIPQLGEGLQEARLVEFLKQPGDLIRRDEQIYVMETDKAITEVESPYEGKLLEWLVEEGSVLPIGVEIANMEVAADVAAAAVDAASHGSDGTVARTETADQQPVVVSPKSGPPSDVLIPPRTKRYLKDKGLLDVVEQIPAATTKLSCEDVDRYLATQADQSHAGGGDGVGVHEFDTTDLSSDQQTLNYRMTRGSQVALKAVLETDIDWTQIAARREQVRAAGGPTGFAMFLWCVTQALKQHPRLRSSLSGDGKTLRTYRHVNLGVAVALPGDELKTAVVCQADTMDGPTFFSELTTRIEQARAGIDQVDAATTVSVSNIGLTGMRSGIPLVVTPAAATLALGSIRDQPLPSSTSPHGFEFRKVATLTMSFDHRLLNGIGAAEFLNEVRDLAGNDLADAVC